MMQETQPIFATMVLVATSAFATIAEAQVINEDLKITANDASAFDKFGSSIAISDGIIVTGAPVDDDNGMSSGGAYLHSASTGMLIAKIVPSDGQSSDHFGTSVAISNGIVVVGAPGDDDNGINSGSAYLFDASTGMQLAKLLADDGQAGDEFGYSVGIDNGVVAIGARWDADDGLQSGSAYLFDASTGLQIAKFYPNDGAPGNYFGQSIAISDGIVAVGSPKSANLVSIYAGAAYLFDADPLSPNIGTQIAKLASDDGAMNDYFGTSIAIDNGVVAVGAKWHDQQVGTIVYDRSGAAYLFDVTTGNQMAKLIPDTSETEAWFGYSVGINNDTVVVGSPNGDANATDSGSAYFFSASTGAQTDKLVASDGEAYDYLGWSSATDAGISVVGAYADNDNGNDSGSVYVFHPCPADFTGDGQLNFFDVSAFLGAFSAGHPDGDFNGDGLFNFFDVSAFLAAFTVGCP